MKLHIDRTLTVDMTEHPVPDEDGYLSEAPHESLNIYDGMDYEDDDPFPTIQIVVASHGEALSVLLTHEQARAAANWILQRIPENDSLPS